MGYRRRKALCAPAARRRPVHHSDRGVQHASAEYRQAMQSADLRASMSRKGDCYDNAPMESFFHALKTELVYHRRYATRTETTRHIFAYDTPPVHMIKLRKSGRSHLTFGCIRTTTIGDDGAGAAPQCLGFRSNGAQSICANASAACRRAPYFEHRPIRFHFCDRGTRARGQFHHSPRRKLRDLRQMAQLKRATILRARNASRTLR
jgi:hypothetical protein